MRFGEFLKNQPWVVLGSFAKNEIFSKKRQLTKNDDKKLTNDTISYNFNIFEKNIFKHL